MPGRPKTMLKRVSDFLLTAQELDDHLRAVCPRACLDTTRDDAVAVAWRAVVAASAETWIGLEELQELLSEKLTRSEYAPIDVELAVLPDDGSEGDDADECDEPE